MLASKSDAQHCTLHGVYDKIVSYELLSRSKRVPESVRKPIRWVAAHEHHNYVMIRTAYITHKMQFVNIFRCSTIIYQIICINIKTIIITNI